MPQPPLLLALRAALAALVLLAWAGPAPASDSGPVIEQIRAQGRLVIGHRESSVPFSYRGPDKRPIGYAVDVCRRLAAAVQARLALPALPIEYLQLTPANRIEMIETGKAQLECGSTTNNAQRREKVAFTIPHFITGARMLVKANSGIDRIDQPEVKRVAITRNTTPLAAVRRIQAERGLRFEIVETEDHEKAVQMVERGEAQVFVMDDVLLYGLASTRPDPKALKVVGRFITTEPLTVRLSADCPAAICTGAASAIDATDCANKAGLRVYAGTMAVPRRKRGSHAAASARGVNASAPSASADQMSV